MTRRVTAVVDFPVHLQDNQQCSHVPQKVSPSSPLHRTPPSLFRGPQVSWENQYLRLTYTLREGFSKALGFGSVDPSEYSKGLPLLAFNGSTLRPKQRVFETHPWITKL